MTPPVADIKLVIAAFDPSQLLKPLHEGSEIALSFWVIPGR
jgi:hypothetical protein